MGPPVSRKKLAARAKLNTTVMIKTAQIRNNHGLKFPLRAAATAGSAKMPAPMTPLSAMAEKPIWPISRLRDTSF